MMLIEDAEQNLAQIITVLRKKALDGNIQAIDLYTYLTLDRFTKMNINESMAVDVDKIDINTAMKFAQAWMDSRGKNNEIIEHVGILESHPKNSLPPLSEIDGSPIQEIQDSKTPQTYPYRRSPSESHQLS